MKCVRALFSVCLSFFCEVAVTWWECGERPVGTSTDGTPAGGVWLRLNVCFLSLENQEQHTARASRLIVKHSSYITGQSGMPVQQYDITAGARRPTPQQPAIGCGLPGPYGGNVYGKARLLPIAACMSQNVSPRLLRKSLRCIVGRQA